MSLFTYIHSLLCVPEPYEGVWMLEVLLHSFVTSALDGNKWAYSLPGCFTPGDTAPVSRWIGDLVGLELVWTLWKLSAEVNLFLWHDSYFAGRGFGRHWDCWFWCWWWWWFSVRQRNAYNKDISFLIFDQFFNPVQRKT